MQPGTEKERSPVLATCLGCLGMSLIPLAVLAVLMGAVYMYLESSKTADEEEARQDQLEMEQRRLSAKAEPMTALEQNRLAAEIEKLGSTDEALRKKAEIAITGYSSRKPQAVREAMERTLRQSKNAQQIGAVTAFLCAYQRDDGVKVVTGRIVDRRDDVLFLRAVREGVMSVENATLRERALNEIVTTLERSGSQHAGDFFEL